MECAKEFFSTYKTSQKVYIKSKWLKIPYLLCMTLVVAYIILYELGYKKDFMQMEGVYARTFGYLEKPMSADTFLTCTDIDLDCDRAKLERKPKYCTDDSLKHPGSILMHGVRHQRNVSGCVNDDVHMAASSAFMIPTLKTWIYQSWNATMNEWMNDRVVELYLEDIESFLVRIEHGFRAQEIGLQEESANMQGFIKGAADDFCCYIPLRFKEGDRTVSCDDVNSSTGECAYHQPRGHAKCPDGFGTEENVQLWSSKWGDTLTVRKLLEFANFSLDDKRPNMGNLTYRQSGAPINIQVQYNNMDNFVWLPGDDNFYVPTPYYTYGIAPGSLLANQAVVETTVDDDGDPHAKKRTLQRVVGLKVQISATGVLGAFQMRKVMTTIAVTTSLFTIAVIFVEWVIVRMYRSAFCHCLCHKKSVLNAAYMLEVYQEDKSLDEHRFAEVLEELHQGKDAFEQYIEVEKEENLYHHNFRNRESQSGGAVLLSPTVSS